MQSCESQRFLFKYLKHIDTPFWASILYVFLTGDKTFDLPYSSFFVNLNIFNFSKPGCLKNKTFLRRISFVTLNSITYDYVTTSCKTIIILR